MPFTSKLLEPGANMLQLALDVRVKLETRGYPSKKHPDKYTLEGLTVRFAYLVDEIVVDVALRSLRRWNGLSNPSISRV